MSVLSLIIKREFVAKVRNKSFIVMTFLSPLLMVGLVAFVAYLSTMKSDVKEIAIHDESNLFVKEFKNSDEYHYLDRSNVDLKVLKDSIMAEKYEAVLYIPKVDDNKELSKKIQYISNDSPSLSYIDDLESIIAQKLTKSNFEKANLDTLAIRNAEAQVDISLAKASGEETVKGLNEIKIFIGAAFGYLIMMFIIIYGNMVMRSVIEEKTNRIIEIIISSVKPFKLMLGKIIGTSLAGVLQFVIWALLGGILLFVVSVFLGINIGASSSMSPEMMATANEGISGNMQLYVNEFRNLPIVTLLVSFIVYFIGGYFLYSSIYAAIGAAVDNETDSQQFLLPIILPLMLGVYVGFFSVLNDPHGTVATVFSFIPLTSPIVMLMRIPFGVPWWQIVVSLVLLFGTFFLVVWFASKIYRIGILMYGKKPTWKELYKWLKY
ncbi:ABC transporter permease [Flavobacterium lindanitolerans]|uniref:ABC-2 type transport system permease protein n=1 Tax=Flavobacterium lindanitolerans TaxID=428988 RepID=A0A497VDH0_9FLAO|nr:ABC transporter permease [Flavobacterium lindanitolerans]PKW29746.1 ABC-2 type transport system permease protein [Flavobacterium lindanitolerans]RLJ34753.1 ABC-2 type transport system permease protein [Flavobacterium lindanitolerans]